MKQIKYIHIIFILIICISACETNNNIKSDNNFFNQEYQHSKKEFPDSLTKHFPEKLNEENVFYSTSINNKPKEILYLIVANKLTNKNKTELNNLKYTSDTCIIKIYIERNTYGFNKKGLGKCKSYIPAPDYSLLIFDDNKQKPDDLKYYVLQTSHHIFINHELYLRYYLPDEWKNGMSRGIAVSEKEKKIYYWLIMW